MESGGCGGALISRQFVCLKQAHKISNGTVYWMVRRFFGFVFFVCVFGFWFFFFVVCLRTVLLSHSYCFPQLSGVNAASYGCQRLVGPFLGSHAFALIARLSFPL